MCRSEKIMMTLEGVFWCYRAPKTLILSHVKPLLQGTEILYVFSLVLSSLFIVLYTCANVICIKLLLTYDLIKQYDRYTDG